MHEILVKSPIFKGLSRSEIIHIMNIVHFREKKVEKEELIIKKGEECNYLYIVIKGSVRGEMEEENGKILKVEDIYAPNSFATGFIFADNNKMKVNIIANEPTTIILFNKEDVIALLMQNKILLKNFLGIVSNKFTNLVQKIKILQMSSLDSKIAQYILKLSHQQNALNVSCAKTHQQLADYFSVTRPAFTRTMNKLVKQGLIETSRKEIKIVDIEGLKKLLN